jgi:Ca2+-binding RTX toxin-like protein
MAGSSSVTVPGASGVPVTVALGTGDILHLASQIGSLLTTVQGAGNLSISQGAFGSPLPAAPATSSPTVTDLIISGATSGAATIPAGYSYVVDVNSTSSTLTGSNVALIAGTAGGSFNVSGQSTVAVEGGNNQIMANGQYLISTAPGNDTISASGIGTVATDTGANLISVSGINLVESIGQDTIVAGAGLTTVDAGGSNSFVAGSSSGVALLSVSVTGSNVTVSAATSNTSVTTAGSNALVFGGQTGAGTLSVLDMGTNDSISGVSSPTTVTAGSGSTGLFVFGGSGSLTFVGGSSAATILGGSSSNSIVGGTGGVLVGAGATDTITGQASGGATVFGTSGSDVTYLGAGGLLYAAGVGSETLNAATSTGTNDLFAVGSGNVSIVGGTNTNLYDAGAGSDTFTGGGGSNTYFFLAQNTAGAHDFVTNLASNDVVGLIGYNPAESTITVANGSATLTLSDKTQITFLNVTNITNNIHYG